MCIRDRGKTFHGALDQVRCVPFVKIGCTKVLVRFMIAEHMINRSKHVMGNGNNGAFGTAATLKTMKERRQICLLYTSPSPRDRTRSRMPSSA